MTKTWNGVQYDHTDRGAEQAAKHGIARSPHWEHFKEEYEKTHPKQCAYCGSTHKVQLHHCEPFHLDPSRELDPTNMIWLCEESPSDHHLKIGHLGDFKKFNPNVVEDCRMNEQKLRKSGLWK
jgi:hypothetical protein